MQRRHPVPAVAFPGARRGLAAIITVGSVALLVAPIPALASAEAQQAVVYRARDRVLPALVHVEPILEVFREGEKEKVAVTGSGVIFSPEGYVLTNHHVVARAERVLCTLHDQEEVPATVVGRDPWTDLAVLKLDTSDLRAPLRPARLGRSADLQAGQFVMALGSPLGLARSLSLGVISSVDRYFPETRDVDGVATGTFNTWIQTDAAINPGNSGGPLVDLHGAVVGINARAIPIVGENLGFAIPIDLARDVAQALIANGEVRRSWLGVAWQSLADAPGRAAPADGKGALIGSVAAGSPADAAGLLPGDIVLNVGGREVIGRHDEQLPGLRRWLADLPAGRALEISFARGGQPRRASIVPAPLEDLQGSEREFRAWGFTARDLTEDLARQLRLVDRAGALVTGVKPASFAAEAGLRPGDVVRRMEGQDVPSLRVLEQRVERLTEARVPRVLLEVQRGRTRAFVLLEPIYEPRAAGEGSR